MRVITMPPDDELRCMHCGKQAKKEKHFIRLEDGAGDVSITIYYCEDENCNYLALEFHGWG